MPIINPQWIYKAQKAYKTTKKRFVKGTKVTCNEVISLLIKLEL